MMDDFRVYRLKNLKLPSICRYMSMLVREMMIIFTNFGTFDTTKCLTLSKSAQALGFAILLLMIARLVDE